MSEKLCTLRTKGGGGGKYTETSLWTNPSPTSNFAAQTVTLSDSIDHYKYIKIRYAYSATSQLDTQKYEDIRTVETFKKGTYPQTDYIPQTQLGVYASNIATARVAMYASSTSVRFGTASNIAQTGSADNRAIPLEILGLNELDHGKRESSLGTLTYQTSSNFKVTLGFKPKALQVFMRGNDSNTITLQYDENISTTKYVRNYTASTPQSGWQTIGSATNQRRLWSIDDDGFTLTPNTDTSTPTIYYSAVGDV